MAAITDSGIQDKGLKLNAAPTKNDPIIIEHELVTKNVLNKNDLQDSNESAALQERPSRIDLVTPEPDPSKLCNGTETSNVGEQTVLQSNKEEQVSNMAEGFEKGSFPEYTQCTACNKKLNIKKRKVCKHPKLGVIICKTCLKFINCNEFTRDDMGIEEFCTWCGDGGNLVCCDFCEKAYCKHCVKNNMGKEFLKALLDAEDDVKWKCFCCDQAQLQSFKRECHLILSYVDELKKNDRMYVERNTSAGLTQYERKKRLTEVEKQVACEPEVNVQHKSSFRNAEDTQNAVALEENTASSVEGTASIIENDQSSEKQQVKPFDNRSIDSQQTKKTFSLKTDKVRPIIPMLGTNDVSDIITKIRADTSNNPTAGRHHRRKAPVSYNETQLQKSAEKSAERKLEEIEKSVKHKAKKKRTVIMLSSESEADEVEIIVLSKNGRKRVLNKHMLLEMIQTSETKNQKVKKKLSDFMRIKVDANAKRSVSSDGSSSCDDRNGRDSEEADSEVAGITEKEPPKSTMDENGYRIVVDGQQPGPSGVRPKNKMQIRRQQLERKRKMSTSDSDSDDNFGKPVNHRVAKKRLNYRSPFDDHDKTMRTPSSIGDHDKTIESKETDTALRTPSSILDPIEINSAGGVLELPKVTDKVEMNEPSSKEDNSNILNGDGKLKTSEVNHSNESTEDNEIVVETNKDITPSVDENMDVAPSQDEKGKKSIEENVTEVGDVKKEVEPDTTAVVELDESDIQKQPIEGSGNDSGEHEEEVVQKSKSRSASISSNDSDNDVKVSAKKSKIKKRRRRTRLASNTSEEEVPSSDDDVDDDFPEKLPDSSSDSSSDGSVIVTRKSKRNATQKPADPIGRKKGRNKKGSKRDNEKDEEDIQSPNKGRKRIRRILKDHELNEETIHARELEEQRRKRLLERTKADRQEKYHVVLEEEGDLVLERNNKKEVLCSVDTELNKHLKPHQRKGVQFMYDCIIETVSSYKKGDSGGGCLLAHCMGLGKTLQVVAFIHTLINCENIRMKRFLVVAPLNTVLNWEQEFEKWLSVDKRIDVSVLSRCNDNKERVQMIRDWFEEGGVIITGYEMYRNLVNGTYIKSKKMKEDIKKCFVEPGPECVICDEGHILRNDTSAISKAMNAINTKRRIVLTGTPLQNNLPEYHVMVDFVKPKLLGTRKEFQNRFVNPIHNGQCSNSTPRDVKVMKQRAHVLYQLLSGCVQRQDYSVLSPFLPQKREYTIFVRLTEKQIKMYKYYIENFVYKDGNNKLKGSSLFSDFQCLARIWTHPWSLHIERERQWLRNRYKEDDSMDEFIDDEDDESESSDDEETPKPWTADTSSDEEKASKRRRSRKAAVDDSSSSSGSEKENTKEDQLKATRVTRSAKVKNERQISDDDDTEQTKQPSPEKIRGNLRSGVNFKDASQNPAREEEKPIYEKEWYDEFISEEDQHNAELSGKLILMLEILANAEVVGDKVLIFSQSLTSLDLIESTLAGRDIGDDQLNWLHGIDYFRMDGSTPVQKRKRWADIFNDPENDRCRLFLISTKSGSLGINMVAANRVIIFDCSWNPSHDVQSVFRVYRFGQEKPVYVYRFIAQGSMEEKIYGRQINKLAVSGRVVDEMQIERHFTDEEIRDLYTFAPEPIKEGETPQLPKDPLLAEVLQRQHPKYIARYHEHDLLLENIEGEELSEEERKQAWKSYEEEKENAARGIRMDFRSGMYDVQFSGAQNIPQNTPINNIASNIIRMPPIPDNIPFEERRRLEIERSQKLHKALIEIHANHRRMQSLSVGRYIPMAQSNSQMLRPGGQPIVAPVRTVSTDSSNLLKILPSMSASGIVKIPGLGNCQIMPAPRNAPSNTVFVRPPSSTVQIMNNNVGPTRNQQPHTNPAAVSSRPSKYDIPKEWK